METEILKTYSGKPYRSVEQRRHFEAKRDELLTEIPELLHYDAEIRKLPIIKYLDWPTFLKADCFQIGTHPIHTAFKSLENCRRMHHERLCHINLMRDTKQITDEMADFVIDWLEMRQHSYEAEFCVVKRREFHDKYGTSDKAVDKCSIRDMVKRREIDFERRIAEYTKGKNHFESADKEQRRGITSSDSDATDAQDSR